MTESAASTSPFDSAPPRGKLSDVSHLWPWLAPHRARLVGALCCAVVATGAAMLVSVVIGRVIIDHILLTRQNALAPDFGQQALVDAIAEASRLDPLVVACALAGAWIFLAAVGNFIFLTQFARASHLGLSGLRIALFAHATKLPPSFFDRVSVGQILTRIANDVESLAELFVGLGNLAGVIIPFGVAASVMLALDARLTLELTPILPLAALANYIFRKAVGGVHHAIRANLSRLSEYLHENLAGIEVVQSCRREALNLARYDAILDETRAAETTATRLETSYFPFVENLSYLALGLILWLGGRDVFDGRATLGSMVLFIQFSDMLFRPVIALGDQATNVLRARAASARIFRLLDWEERLREPAVPRELPSGLRGKIEFRNLSFAYGEGAQVLRDVTLIVNPGESLAIVGPTGSGKTTMTRLICRFYDARDGSLFIDDVDVMQVAPRDIRRRVGVIFQDFHIFAGTVFENVALGDERVTRARAVEAARTVGALAFIEALPLGFDTPLGDRGHNLSHGQRQLLAFARAIARDPEILILDEATANVDPQTEAAIQMALAKTKAGRTSIVVAHRLRTVRDASRIVVLDGGRIVESGTHEQLVATGGLYKTQFELQE
jgi:ATP-binding cassette subfamily B multidrug efflux pump